MFVENVYNSKKYMSVVLAVIFLIIQLSFFISFQISFDINMGFIDLEGNMCSETYILTSKKPRKIFLDKCSNTLSIKLSELKKFVLKNTDISIMDIMYKNCFNFLFFYINYFLIHHLTAFIYLIFYYKRDEKSSIAIAY